MSTETTDSRPLSDVSIERRKFETLEHEFFDVNINEIDQVASTPGQLTQEALHWLLRGVV